MIQETNTILAPVDEEFTELSLAQDLRQLADEAKALAQAEIAFQKSRAAFVSNETKTIGLLAIAALVVIFFALMAFVVGTVIALGPLVGPWGAMALVTIALLILALACGMGARSRLKNMMVVAGNGKET